MGYLKIFTVIVLCVSTAVFSSCQRKNISPSEQTIYYRVTDEPVTLDPQIADDNPSRLVIMNIFEGLTRLDENDNAVQGVADSWKADISKMEYTFHIRENAKWSDGSPLTAQDFVYGFQRLFSAKTGSATAKELFCIKNSEKVRNNELDISELGVYAENENTLKIKLEYLDPQFTALLAEPADGLGHGHREEDIVSGPETQGNMPSAPEVRQVHREVRTAEVSGHIDAHAAGHATGDVYTAAEIHIELDGVTEHGDDHRPAGILIPVDEDFTYQGADPVSDDQFFEESPENQLRSMGKVLISESMPLIQLFGQLIVSGNGSLYDLREE